MLSLDNDISQSVLIGYGNIIDYEDKTLKIKISTMKSNIFKIYNNLNKSMNIEDIGDCTNSIQNIQTTKIKHKLYNNSFN